MAQIFQSETPDAPFSRPQATLALTRGVQRLLRALGRTSLAELPLPSGRRADLVALGAAGEFWIIEIKSSIADFRADRKWAQYQAHCDRFYFAVGSNMPLEILPPDIGLIVADPFGGVVLREAPVHKMAGATRRGMLLRFAQTGAERLHRSNDPGACDISAY